MTEGNLSEMLEEFWADVLSANPDRVRSAIDDLSDTDRRSVVVHLRRMAHQAGWSEAQRLRAQAALDALGVLDTHDE
jgi:hypothetical protein